MWLADNSSLTMTACGENLQPTAVFGKQSDSFRTEESSLRMKKTDEGGWDGWREEGCGKLHQESVCWWWSYLSGVDLLSVDGRKKLWLALLQFDPVWVDLEEAHPLLQGKEMLQMKTEADVVLRGEGISAQIGRWNVKDQSFLVCFFIKLQLSELQKHP